MNKNVLLEEMDSDSETLAQAFAKRLNVDAPTFVPNFGPPPTSATKQDADDEKLAPAAVLPQQQPLPTGNGNSLDDEKTPSPPQTLIDDKPSPTPAINADLSPVDDWENNADDDMNADDDDDDLDDEDESMADSETQSVPKPKKKPKKRLPSESLDPEHKKEHLNIVFIGHVDAGKSTIGGQLLFLTGMVDKRTLEKYEREAKEKNRESWYLSWALDTNQEERDKGKTVEVGRAFFSTEHKHFTLLDAPGKATCTRLSTRQRKQLYLLHTSLTFD